MYDKPRYLPAGDRAMVVEFGDTIDPETNRSVRDMFVAIDKAEIPGVVEMVPTYRSILISYDPLKISDSGLREKVESVQGGLDESPVENPRVVLIPTLYGGEYGPDLSFVAEHAGINEEQVVSVHSGVQYLVYMIGFSPGFPYLGGLPESLHTPRLETPRTSIPAGSVGIADSQTGVYPLSSPGGWQLIGRTPLKLFDPIREPPGLLSAGYFVRFQPIASEKDYQNIQRRVESGEYEVVEEDAS